MPIRTRDHFPLAILVLGLLHSFTAGTSCAQMKSPQKPQRVAASQTARDLNDKQGDYEKNARRAVKRDAFRVFDNPTMTPAADSSTDDQEYVIGVHCDGKAKAYPVAVMGRHELGNDTCGETHITVSW